MQTIIKCGSKAVAASSNSVTITFANDAENETSPAAFPAGYTVILPTPCPDWATSVRSATPPTTSVALFTFGTATGTGGGIIEWIAIGFKLT